MRGEAFELEFNYTIDTTSAKVKGWLVNYLGNTQDAEDIYSESIKDLWKFGARFNGGSSLAVPFFRITRRRVVDFLRKKYKQKQAEDFQFIVNYFSTQPMFRLNMLLHPLWRHMLGGDQVSLLGAIKKTMEEDDGSRFM